VFLLGNVFKGETAFVVALTYAVYGLLVGLPVRTALGWLVPADRPLSRKGAQWAVLSGVCSAIGLVAYLYSLGQSLAFAEPMANALPVVLLGLTNRHVLRRSAFLVGAALILLAGVFLGLKARVGLPLVVAVVVRASMLAISESIEPKILNEPRSRFDGVRFAAMAVSGIVVGVGALASLNRLEAAKDSIRGGLWPWGVVFSAMMVFNFIASLLKIEAKKYLSLQVCLLANALRVGGFPLIALCVATLMPTFPFSGRPPGLLGLALTVGGMLLVTWDESRNSTTPSAQPHTTQTSPRPSSSLIGEFLRGLIHG
jgi:hypothetical protein